MSLFGPRTKPTSAPKPQPVVVTTTRTVVARRGSFSVRHVIGNHLFTIAWEDFNFDDWMHNAPIEELDNLIAALIDVRDNMHTKAN